LPEFCKCFLGRLFFHGTKHDLTQFDAPLIKTVDVPYHALQKGFVFIQRDQRTQGMGIECAQMYA